MTTARRAGTASSGETAGPSAPETLPSLCIGLVGGQRICRHCLGLLFAQYGLQVDDRALDTEALAAMAQSQQPPWDVLVLLVSGGPFTAFHRIGDTLAKTGEKLPLVVLSAQATRGQVYAALRIGAKAYVNLDAEPEELIRAVRMAARDRVHLSPDAAELLVSDITTSGAEPASALRLPRVELSRREVEVVQLLCEGLSSKEIAQRLHISSKTVENHRYNIYRKCEVEGIAGLMRHAIRKGLVSV